MTCIWYEPNGKMFGTCEECASSMSGSNVIIGTMFLIFIFACVTLFIIGG